MFVSLQPVSITEIEFLEQLHPKYKSKSKTDETTLPSSSFNCFFVSFVLKSETFILSAPSTTTTIRKEEMERSKLRCVVIACTLIVLGCMGGTTGIRFVIDREECMSHNVLFEGDTLHVSFVVIKADHPSHLANEGIDLMIKGPSGEQIKDFRDKTSEKFEFVIQKKGVYRFCFTNKSPYQETIDFDVQVGHFSVAHYDQHAKDEHFAPLLEQIARLEEVLYNIQFEQHWLEAQTDRQAIVNENMGQRAVQKAMIESAALIAASILQVYLLRRLFERKLGSSRV